MGSVLCSRFLGAAMNEMETSEISVGEGDIYDGIEVTLMAGCKNPDRPYRSGGQ